MSKQYLRNWGITLWVLFSLAPLSTHVGMSDSHSLLSILKSVNDDKVHHHQVFGHVEHWGDHLCLPLWHVPLQRGRGYQWTDPECLLHVTDLICSWKIFGHAYKCKTQVPAKPLEGDLNTGHWADHQPPPGRNKLQRKCQLSFFYQVVTGCKYLFYSFEFELHVFSMCENHFATTVTLGPPG